MSIAAGRPAQTSAATLPSCVALCASIGLPAMSPIAKTPFTVVFWYSSTTIKPLSLTFISVFSSCKSSVFGFLPTATRTFSYIYSFVSLFFSIETLTSPSDSTSTLVTFEESIMDLNCFFNFLIRGFVTSSSAPGTKLGIYSTTETIEPKVLYTCPNSRPIIPPPIIKRDFGTESRFKAVFDVNMDGWFLGTFGNIDELEPEAIIQFLNLIFSSPSFVSTKISQFVTNEALPDKTLTFLALAN